MAAVGIAVTATTVALLLGRGPGTEAVRPLGGSVNPPVSARVLVHVSGAVAHPGLYELSPDARVADAVAAAGGPAVNADPGHVPNLAGRVKDGQQVNVPFRKAGGTSGANSKLDINVASRAELVAVPGMPEGLPDAILEYRSQWGGFHNLTELRDALGVDRATVADLGKSLRVSKIP